MALWSLTAGDIRILRIETRTQEEGGRGEQRECGGVREVRKEGGRERKREGREEGGREEAGREAG